MNRRLVIVAALIAPLAFAAGVFAILLIPLGDGSQPPPEEVISTSAQRFRAETKSIEGSFNTEVKLNEHEARSDGNFAFLAPDRMDLSISSQGGTMEILLAEGRSYLRFNHESDWYQLEGEWQGLDPDKLELFLESRGFLNYGNLASRLFRLERLPDERIDDGRYSHYWGFIQSRDMSDVFLTGLTGQDLGTSGLESESEPVETHLWLERDTLLPRRVQIRAENKLAEQLTSTQTITFEFAGYGQDVRLPDVPTSTKRLVDQLQEGSTLGLRCSSATKFLRDRYGLPEGRGCVALRVDSPSAAEEAGFQLGDKMIAMDGMRITSGRQFTFLFEDLPSTDHHTFVVQRGNEELTLEVDLADRAGTPKEDPYLYYLRAKALSAQSTDSDANFDQIVADYNRQIEQDPAFELPYLYRGDVRIGKNNEAARADLENALALDPTLAEAHRLLAQLADHQDDFDTAIEHINRSIELNGCGEALASWDLDCAEDLTNRTAFYLSRLKEGDDLLIEHDLKALEGVIFFEPMLVWGKISLAFARGDDATVHELGEQFIGMRLTRLSDYLKNRQASLEKDISASAGTGTFTMPTWQMRDASRTDQSGDQVWVIPVVGEKTDGFALVYAFELPSTVWQSTISGELWRGPYRLAAFDFSTSWGKTFRAELETDNGKLLEGAYELRIQVNGQVVKTVGLEAPHGPERPDVVD